MITNNEKETRYHELLDQLPEDKQQFVKTYLNKDNLDLTIEEVADLLEISTRTVFNWLKRPEIAEVIKAHEELKAIDPIVYESDVDVAELMQLAKTQLHKQLLSGGVKAAETMVKVGETLHKWEVKQREDLDRDLDIDQVLKEIEVMVKEDPCYYTFVYKGDDSVMINFFNSLDQLKESNFRLYRTLSQSIKIDLGYYNNIPVDFISHRK